MCRIFIVIMSVLILSACSMHNYQQRVRNNNPAYQLQQGEEAFRYQDYMEAYKRLLPLAKKGNADAQYAIGYMYFYGDGGLPQDPIEARKWLRSSADQGNEMAQQALVILEKNHKDPYRSSLAVPLGHGGHYEGNYPNSRYSPPPITPPVGRTGVGDASRSAHDGGAAIQMPVGHGVTPLPNFPQ